MQDISLHILDIAQNSVTAGARIIKIVIKEETFSDYLIIDISDDGRGMDEEMTAAAIDPFTTTRTTRKVGLGLPLFKASADGSGGFLKLWSEFGVGTRVKAVFQLSHIDRPPMGNIIETLLALVLCNPDIDIIYHYSVNDKKFDFDTRLIKDKMQDIPINHPNVMGWIKEYLEDGMNSLSGGA